MDSRLLWFLAIACAVSRIDGQNITTFTGNITRSGCGVTKLCPAACDPTVNVTTSICYFGSSQLQGNSTLFFELSGTSSGYVALGLGTSLSQGPSFVFICGNNNTGFFFTTGTNSSSGLNTNNVTISTIYAVQGAVTGNQTLNQTLIQCTFTTSTTLGFTRSASTQYFFYLLAGTITGGNLDPPSFQFNTRTLVDLTNPSGNITTNTTNSSTNATSSTVTANPSTSGKNALANPLAHALAILLSAMGLILLY